MARPYIVVWEGVDGAGKTTLMKRVKEILEERGFKVLTYKTPSNSPTGEFAIRYGNEPGIDHLTRMLLFLANTSDDSKRMRVDLARSPDFYFIDRYYLCSIVYGLAFSRLNGVEASEGDFTKLLDMIEKLGDKVFLKPDLYVIVDAPEENRIRRLTKKPSQGGLEDELERDLSMQRHVRELYRVFAEAKPDQVLWIMNPEGRLEETAHAVAEKLISKGSLRTLE
ncbi:MAG: thymidylate kinase [Aigarchaeota archaeon]|nr:thymidylate kinase [Aigarchaeota archaeon]MDW8021496.1 dTMP kinase [Nitrososphaerota archaeon]